MPPEAGPGRARGYPSEQAGEDLTGTDTGVGPRSGDRGNAGRGDIECGDSVYGTGGGIGVLLTATGVGGQEGPRGMTVYRPDRSRGVIGPVDTGQREK
ncbi:hypothetical protein FMUBM48_03040 [Nocardia cyriacigeorgica]|nr:hypothetical protein FMUBM48_03040 [Nocardia cyriacigeorgica]